MPIRSGIDQGRNTRLVHQTPVHFKARIQELPELPELAILSSLVQGADFLFVGCLLVARYLE